MLKQVKVLGKKLPYLPLFGVFSIGLSSVGPDPTELLLEVKQQASNTFRKKFTELPRGKGLSLTIFILSSPFSFPDLN